MFLGAFIFQPQTYLKRCAPLLLGILFTSTALAAKLELRETNSLQNSITVPIGSKFSIDVVMDAEYHKTNAVEIYITFAPAYLLIVDANPVKSQIQPFQKREFYKDGTEILNSVKENQLCYSIGIINRDVKLPTGSAVVATANFIAKKIGATRLTFNSEEADWREGKYTFFTIIQGSDVLPRSFKNLIDAEINITGTKPIVLKGIPDVELIEDTPNSDIDLDGYLTLNEGEKEQLIWTFKGIFNIGGKVDPSTRRLTLTPKHNWKGTEEITVIVTNPSNAFASNTFVATVHPDPSDPVISGLPPVTFESGTSDKSTDLDLYVTDKDTPASNITWEVRNNFNVNVEIDSITHIVTFTSRKGWTGTEALVFVAIDQEENDDVQTLTVTVTPGANGTTFQLEQLPDIEFEQDETYQFDLDDYVKDSIFPESEIRWKIDGNENIKVEIDNSSHIAAFSTLQRDWLGSEKITVTATAPDETSASQIIMVTIREPSLKYFTIAIIPNPIQADYIDIVVVVKEGVQINSLKATWKLAKPVDVAMKQIIHRIWRGTYILPTDAKGTVTIEVSGTDAKGSVLANEAKKFVIKR